MALRVVTGPTEVAGTGWGLREALRAVGVDAEVVLWSPPPSQYPSGRVLSRRGRIAFAAAAPARYDVFHYHYGSTWLRFADAWWARAWRRTLVVRYHGDDCRIHTVAARSFEARARVVSPERERQIRARLRRLGRICHAALVADLELATYVRPYYARVYVTPLALHPATDAPVAERPRERPLVVHAATAPEVKGTAAITAAVETVAARVPLEYRLLVREPHADVENALRHADVVIDQLNSATSGVFALEALRLGVPVIGELDRGALPPYQRELPIVSATPSSLADELERLLRDPARRADLGERGRRYVERVYDPARIGRTMVAIYAHARTAPPGVYHALDAVIDPL